MSCCTAGRPCRNHRGDKVLIDTIPFFRLLMSPEFKTLASVLIAGVPDERRCLISVSAFVPPNASARCAASQACSLVLFLPCGATDAEMAAGVCLALTSLHSGQALSIVRELQRRHGILPTSDVARRCCQIVGDARLWAIFDRPTDRPVLPHCISTSTTSPFCTPAAIDQSASSPERPSAPCTRCVTKTSVPLRAASVRGNCNGVITRFVESEANATNAKDFASARADVHPVEVQSHAGYLCYTTLLEVESWLSGKLAAFVDLDEGINKDRIIDWRSKCSACALLTDDEARAMTIAPRAIVDLDASCDKKKRTTINSDTPMHECPNCLTNTLERVRVLIRWADEHRSEKCMGTRNCACVYTTAVRTSGAFVNLVAQPEPYDPCYDTLHDSIFDRHSPLVQDFISQQGSAARLLVDMARVARPPRSGGSGVDALDRATRPYTFGSRFTYETLLDAARRLYALPDAPTLSAIAVRNSTSRSPRLTRQWLVTGHNWLPLALQQRLAMTSIELVAKEAARTVARDGSVFSPSLEKLILAELVASENRRLAMLRFASFVAPRAQTVCEAHGAAVYIVVALAFAELCESTALTLADEASARALAEIARLSAEAEQRAANEEAARRAAKRAKEAVTRERRTAKSNERRGKTRERPSAAPTPTEYASARVLAKSREPIVKLSAAELEALRVENESKLRMQQKAVDDALAESNRALLAAGVVAGNEPLKKRLRAEDARLYQSTGRLVCLHLLGDALYSAIFEKLE